MIQTLYSTCWPSASRKYKEVTYLIFFILLKMISWKKFTLNELYIFREVTDVSEYSLSYNCKGCCGSKKPKRNIYLLTISPIWLLPDYLYVSVFLCVPSSSPRSEPKRAMSKQQGSLDKKPEAKWRMHFRQKSKHWNSLRGYS